MYTQHFPFQQHGQLKLFLPNLEQRQDLLKLMYKLVRGHFKPK